MVRFPPEAPGRFPQAQRAVWEGYLELRVQDSVVLPARTVPRAAVAAVAVTGQPQEAAFIDQRLLLEARWEMQQRLRTAHLGAIPLAAQNPKICEAARNGGLYTASTLKEATGARVRAENAAIYANEYTAVSQSVLPTRTQM